jgi:hypothetical protein
MTDVPSVARARENALKVLFGRANRVLIGVVHLLPLPGSPDFAGGGSSRSTRGLSRTRGTFVGDISVCPTD